MIKKVIICFVIFFSFACNNDELEQELIFMDYIQAGVVEDLGILYTDNLSDTLRFWSGNTRDSILIDINMDGINDFVLRASGLISPGISNFKATINTLDNNEIAIAGNKYVDTLSINDTINNETNWSSGSLSICRYDHSYLPYPSINGLWFEKQNKYIGAKVLVDDKVLYGWIKIEITGYFTLKFYDFACTDAYAIY